MSGPRSGTPSKPWRALGTCETSGFSRAVSRTPSGAYGADAARPETFVGEASRGTSFGRPWTGGIRRNGNGKSSSDGFNDTVAGRPRRSSAGPASRALRVAGSFVGKAARRLAPLLLGERLGESADRPFGKWSEKPWGRSLPIWGLCAYLPDG